jgi:SulP family sulfate permease
VVGDIPHALPDLAIPDVNADDIVKLITPAFGVLIMSAEAVGVARQLAVKHGYRVDANRDLMALGAGNLVAGLSSGFVQSGGASQTAAADGAGGRSQLASIICAGLLLLTGAFLAPLFEHLPQATLAAIVIVAIMGFYDVGELRRFAVVRRSALLLATVALAGVLVLGVLQGLIVAAGLSLVYVVFRLSRPAVGELGRDPRSGAWGWLDRHPGWAAPPGMLVIRSDGQLLYPNVDSVRERVLEAVAAAGPRPEVVVLDLSQSVDLDLQAVDGIADLARQLGAQEVELRLAAVRAPAAEILQRAGVTPGVAAFPTVSAAVDGAVSRPAR